MMRSLRYFVLLLAFLVFSVNSPLTANALPKIAEMEFLTGSATGSWYAIGAGICSKLNELYDGFPFTAIPGPGSLAAPAISASGDVAFAMSYPPFLVMAEKGEPPYERPFKELRAVCSMMPTVVQPMTSIEGINTFDDLFSKKIKFTLGLYPIGNGSTYIATMIIKALGFADPSDVESWGAKLYYASGASLNDAWSDRHIDAQLPLLNVPASAVTEALMTRKDGHLVSFSQDILDNLVKGYGFDHYTILAETYKGQAQDIKTVGVPIVIITTEGQDEELVYNMTKVIHKNKEFFLGVHSSFKEFNPDNMCNACGIPLHTGAIRYYKEVGLIK